MRRLQLAEIEDQQWCPRVLRDAATDYLQFVFELLRQYQPVARELKQLLRRMGMRRIVDLASGGGGPWKSLADLVQLTGEHAVEIALTDKFPNAIAEERSRTVARLTYVMEPVDATHVPERLTGVRTMFTAFHHFEPSAARAVLHDATRERQPIAIFEITQRSFPVMLLVALSPILVLVVMPFIRPFRWSRLLLTYVVPILPLFIAFDGVVSCIRTYSPEELLSLADACGATDYVWQSGRMRTRGPLPVTYLIGYPTTPVTAA